MQIEKKDKTKTTRFIRKAIYLAYSISLILLISVLLAITANRKLRPFYNWIESTRLESYGNYIAGLIIEQKVSFQISATNDPLSNEESLKLNEHLQSSGETIDIKNFSNRDKRFILQYANMNPIKNGRYLILTDSDSPEVRLFGAVLDELYSTFILEMHPLVFEEVLPETPHICFFKNRAGYMSITRGESKSFHDSLGFFSPVKNCIFLFSRKNSYESMEIMQRLDGIANKGKELYKADQLDHYLNVIEKERQKHLDKLQEETICTLRHEGAHQLAHMFGIHSQRGFEKRWLTEGLAQYFETAAPGTPRTQKKLLLKEFIKDNQLFEWETLVNSNEETFLSDGNKHRQLAYSQSWLLVSFLMKNHRSAFFKFIKYKKETSALETPIKDFDYLCELMDIEPQNLSIQLNLEVSNL
jgi:hypothetical protein